MDWYLMNGYKGERERKGTAKGAMREEVSIVIQHLEKALSGVQLAQFFVCCVSFWYGCMFEIAHGETSSAWKGGMHGCIIFAVLFFTFFVSKPGPWILGRRVQRKMHIVVV
jgi:hypothetical protein